MEKKVRFKVWRWIFLSLSILTNTFLILYSTLPTEITEKWNNFFRNIFVSVINTATEKEVIPVPLTKLDLSFSSEETHKYNYLPGYQVNEIPLGSAKQIECTYLPLDTTDKSIQYSIDDSSVATINASGLTASIVGMKAGTTRIHAKNKLSGLESSVVIKVVETVAPTSFEISLESTEISIGSQQTITLEVDGGNLGHNELINFRYYDNRKLIYTSSNESVCTIDNYGVIYPLSIGNSLITVSNSINGFSRSISVNVVDGMPVSLYSDLAIFGSSICYDNDMLKDQNSGNNHYQLGVKDGNTELNPEDFIWESDNELLVKVDKHGVMRGFRKKTVDDESATITAISKLTGQSVSFNVTVKEELPSSIWFSVVNGSKETWNPTDYTACVGDNVVINIGYTPNTSKKDVVVSVSDESVVEFTNQGSSISLRLKTEGNCTLSVTSIINPSLSFSFNLEVMKAGAISSDELEDVGYNIRKVIGHALLFAIAETFTVVALFMFLYKKKIWVYVSISLGIELLLSILSETIQYFEPDRHGTIKDVLINFSGALIAGLLFAGILLLARIIRKKKEQKNQ